MAAGADLTYSTVRSQMTNGSKNLVKNTGKNTRLLWLSGDCERASTMYCIHRRESGGSFIIVADGCESWFEGGEFAGYVR